MGNSLKTVVLLGALSGLLWWLGMMVGGPQGPYLALALVGIFNLGSYFFSDRLVLALYHAQPLGEDEEPRVRRIVQELAGRAGIPMPKLYRLPTAALNAFATGRNPGHAAVAVTDGILRAMNDDEMRGVLGHELSHVLHRDTLINVIAATLGGAIAQIAWMIRWGAIFGGMGSRDNDRRGGGLELLATAIVAPLAATLIQLAVSRTREYDADRAGAELAGHPMGLVSALRKLDAASQAIPLEANPATSHLFIVNPLSRKGVARLFSTHPPIEERIERLLHGSPSVG